MTDQEIMRKLQRPAIAALLDRAAMVLTDPKLLFKPLPMLMAEELTEVAMHLRAQKGETVYVTVWEHEHGDTVDVFTSKEAAQARKDEIADEWWDREIGRVEKPKDGIGERYFEIMSERGKEFFTMSTCVVHGDNT